ncbi:hypothetical protein OUZ56_002406 [Daphnia magna]|uniref:Uncharacterized protein n=1 Tax=Daphnia magna TaxID=35525 RepID=A0ABR0A5M0_9CRUS|nr:hypothetical protein OUZ56_002406 [Daphnia magna]
MKVIGVVSFGAGAVAVGWLGTEIVSIDAEYPEDCAAGDEVKTVVPEDDEEVTAIVEEVFDNVDVIKTGQESEGERGKGGHGTIQQSDNVGSICEPVVTATDEDASARVDSVPIESADVPVCEEPTPASSRKELPVAPVQDRSGDLAAMSFEEFAAVAAEEVSY